MRIRGQVQQLPDDVLLASAFPALNLHLRNAHRAEGRRQWADTVPLLRVFHMKERPPHPGQAKSRPATSGRPSLNMLPSKRSANRWRTDEMKAESNAGIIALKAETRLSSLQSGRVKV
jgi:hypothetical protein